MRGADRSYDPADASHRALRGIQRELERHPAIETVQGFPAGEYTRVVATVATDRFGTDSDEATLTVRWFAGEMPDDRPEFSFHYSDCTADFGWHHEPNPHVDGWGHFQERTGADDEYDYDRHTFSSTNPTRVIWEVLSLLTARLEQ